MTLGLDCSTTCCGFAFFNGAELVDAGFVDISKLKTNKEKAFHIISVLEPNPNMPLVSVIKLEAALSGFQRGKTSQQIVIMLTRFNALVEYILGEHWKIPVQLVSANTARKTVIGKAFTKGMSAKSWVAQELPKVVPNLDKYNKLNKLGNCDKRNEDMRDAVVIAMS